MPSGTIIDLAVLGVVHARDTAPTQISKIAKSLVPDLWYPTTDVIKVAIQRCLDRTHFIDGPLEIVSITDAGRRYLRELLLHNPGDQISPETLALEALQFCFLDTVDSEIAQHVLQRLHRRTRRRLEEFENRCRQCAHSGRFTNIWMGMETHRLETTVRMLALARDKIGPSNATGLMPEAAH